VDNGTAIMAYRVDLLEQCGYTIADMTGITWDKFLEVGKEVYAKTGKALLSMDGGGNDLPYMLLQAEGKSQFKDGKPYITENEDLVKIVKLICDKHDAEIKVTSKLGEGTTFEIIIGASY
jgi:lactose/L-arabinose transport system substrate-binding protein